MCERAGVSRGAHLHHFRTRAALVSAALAELARRRESEFEREVRQLPEGDGRVEWALDLLWSWFNGELFQASVDLAAAARTDSDLRASLVPVERHLARSTATRCREMFSGDPADPTCDQVAQLALATVRGLALLPILNPGSKNVGKQWAFARAQLAELIEARLAARGPGSVKSTV